MLMKPCGVRVGAVLLLWSKWPCSTAEPCGPAHDLRAEFERCSHAQWLMAICTQHLMHMANGVPGLARAVVICKQGRGYS